MPKAKPDEGRPSTAAPAVVRTLTGRTITRRPGGVKSIARKVAGAKQQAKKRLDKRLFNDEAELERFIELSDPLATRGGRIKRKGHTIDGKHFASTAEAVRYIHLKDMEAAGTIEQLECQPRFPVQINNLLVTTYVADFRYRVVDDRGTVLRTTVEDVKGMMTDVYKLKKKLVEASHGFAIAEIPGGKVAKWKGVAA